MIPHKEPIYLFLPNLAEAERVANYCGLASDEWVYIGTPAEKFMRTPKPRTVYFLGEFSKRPDYVKAMRVAEAAGWTVKIREIPPRKND